MEEGDGGDDGEWDAKGGMVGRMFGLLGGNSTPSFCLAIFKRARL